MYINFSNYESNCNIIFNGNYYNDKNQFLSFGVSGKYFNGRVIIPNCTTSLHLAFSNCTNFNQPITIPDSVTNCDRMFYNCTNFNQPVTIGNNVTDCYCMFYNCHNFAQPINIPDNTRHCERMFFGIKFDGQDIYFGNNIYSLSQCFSFCTSEFSTTFWPIQIGSNGNVLTRYELEITPINIHIGNNCDYSYLIADRVTSEIWPRGLKKVSGTARIFINEVYPKAIPVESNVLNRGVYRYAREYNSDLKVPHTYDTIFPRLCLYFYVNGLENAYTFANQFKFDKIINNYMATAGWELNSNSNSLDYRKTYVDEKSYYHADIIYSRIYF